MKTEVERLPKSGVKIKISLDAETVSRAKNHVLGDFASHAEIKGFRKGSAPLDLVEKSLDPAKIRSEIINHLVPSSYDQAIKETMLKPIMLPKIEITSFEEGGTLEFTAQTCEAPKIQIGDYRETLGQLKKSEPPPAKIILGADGSPLQKPDNGAKSEGGDGVQKALDAVLKVCHAEICDLLIEEEVNNMLGRLIDQTGRLGLTVEQYLASVGKDSTALRNEYRSAAEKSLELEFILAEIARLEEINVAEEEISATIKAAPDEESRKNLSQPESRNYLQSVLIKNKVIQKLVDYTK